MDNMETNKIYCGDCLETMKTFPSESIDMCLTSPPYWGLRDYGFEQIFGGDPDCEHDFGIIHRRAGDKSGPHGPGSILGPTKYAQHEIRMGEPTKTCSKCQAWKGQLGLEPTPEFYIEHLTEIFNEVKRVLKKEGTLWLNLGDTYWSAKGSCFNPGGGKDSLENPKKEKGIYPLERGNKSDVPNLPPKCLAMVPERLAWSLIQNGWILRNKNIWHKRNAMPSSVTDRFSNTYEFVYMFSKSQRYYFDLDAVREAHIWAESDKRSLLRRVKATSGKMTQGIYATDAVGYNPDGKNPGDVFEINTAPFPEAHFAVFPEKLCEKPIKAGCPEEVCKKCGKAKERIVEQYDTGGTQKMPDYWEADPGGHGTIHRKGRVKGEAGIPIMANKTIGWTSCDCNAGFEGGIVLDPFAGAGTALYVAKEMKRRYIGIDIKQEYCDMCEKRLAQGVL